MHAEVLGAWSKQTDNSLRGLGEQGLSLRAILQVKLIGHGNYLSRSGNKNSRANWLPES